LSACNTAAACTLADTAIADIAGPLVYDVLSVAGVPAIDGVPGVDVHVVAFVPAVLRVPAVVDFPAVAGALAIASVHVDPGVPILACVFAYCTAQ
jgi:hypothetical protein